MTDAEKMARAERAKVLLSDPLIVEALKTLEDEVFQAFADSPVRDKEGREELSRLIKTARKFKGLLERAVADGQVLRAEIEEREREEGLLSRWRR